VENFRTKNSGVAALFGLFHISNTPYNNYHYQIIIFFYLCGKPQSTQKTEIPTVSLSVFCPKGRKNEIHCTKIGIYE